jgi:hypothetical protein
MIKNIYRGLKNFSNYDLHKIWTFEIDMFYIW